MSRCARRLAVIFSVMCLLILSSCGPTVYTLIEEPSTARSPGPFYTTKGQQAALFKEYEKLQLEMSEAEAVQVMGAPTHRYISMRNIVSTFIQDPAGHVFIYDLALPPSREADLLSWIPSVKLCFATDGKLYFACPSESVHQLAPLGSPINRHPTKGSR